MIHCFVEHITSTASLSLDVPLVGEATPVTVFPDPPTAPTAGPSCQPEVLPLLVGNVVLMRDLAHKGQVFAPYIPAQQTLLVFPGCIEPTARTSLAPRAATTMSAFLAHLHRASGGVDFRVEAAMLCRLSGSAALVLRSPSGVDALALQTAANDVDQQDLDMRMGPLYIQAYPCSHDPQLSTAEPGAAPAERRRGLYYIPTCTLCAQRLEPSLSGLSGVRQDAPLCSCGASPGRSAQQRSCTCLQTSSCTVCQQLASVGQGSTGGGQQQQSQPQQQQQQHVRCQECRQSGDPWICMICGYVGCSRYQAMHAKEHSLRSAHFFSINLLTQQIWDYHSDAFVHHIMFLLDATSGKATRLQYPRRQDAATSALLDGTVAEPAAEADETSVCGVRAATAHVDPFAEKKVISSKHDAKFSPSHTQFATVLKNELDAMRSARTESVWRAALTADPESTLTFEEVATVLKHAEITLPAPWSSEESRSEIGTSTDEHAAGERAVGKTVSVYGDLFASLDGLMEPLVSSRQDEQSIAYCIQHLKHELCLREGEARQFEKEEAELTEELRSTLRTNITRDLGISKEIDELQTTLREIDLNVATQQRLLSRMGSSDAASHFVVMGNGRAGERPSTSRRTSGSREGDTASEKGKGRRK